LLSPPKKKAVGMTGELSKPCGFPPAHNDKLRYCGAAPRCNTAASAVLKMTGRSTSLCARAHARHAA
jgi:hypothetical protein